MSAGKSALIVGATGAVGKYALQHLLSSAEFTRVAEYGRRVTPASNLGVQNPAGKLEQKVIDFEKIRDNEDVKEGKFDVVVITLGTTRAAAGGMENFVKIDREYVLETAKAARVEGMKQRLLYCSAFGASSSAWLPYGKSKGLTEEGLAKLGYDDVIIARPGFLKNRNTGPSRLAEEIAVKVTGLMSYFSPNIEVETEDVGKSMVYAAIHGSDKLPSTASLFTGGGANDVPKYSVIPNKGLTELAKL